MKKQIRTGDKIHCMGVTAEVARILYQERYGTWDVEFIDTQGNYRHWKQYFDGGFIIPKNKQLINCYGHDCTDLFVKYGQPV